MHLPSVSDYSFTNLFFFNKLSIRHYWWSKIPYPLVTVKVKFAILQNLRLSHSDIASTSTANSFTPKLYIDFIHVWLIQSSLIFLLRILSSQQSILSGTIQCRSVLSLTRYFRPLTLITQNSLKLSRRCNLYPSPLRSTDNYVSLFINSITHSVFLSVIQFHLPLPPIVHILLSVSLPQLLLQFLLRLVLTNPSYSRLVLACSINANIDHNFVLRR